MTCVLCGRDREDERHGEDGHKPMVLPDRFAQEDRSESPHASAIQLEAILKMTKRGD